MPFYTVTRSELNKADAKPPLMVNGIAIAYAFDTPVELEPDAAAVLGDTFGFTVTPVEADAPEPEPEPVLQSPATGEDDGAASPDGGAADGGADTFDADAVIEGTVAEVTAKLADLTPEQLEAVLAAEADREVPRKGVTKAIADAIATTKE